MGADLPQRRRTLGHRLVDYLDERGTQADRWHGAIRDWAGRLSSPGGCGTRSRRRPCSTRCWSCAPARRSTALPELGHYPQLEDPPAGGDRAALHGALERATV